MAADMKSQDLIVELDKVEYNTKMTQITLTTDPFSKNIDRVSRIGMYAAQRKSGDEIQKLLNEHPDEYGIITGDETRLSQVLNNLIRSVKI